ncbi:MAG: hypothetical protein LBU65_06955 [Planctomycetaceae bacterium]|nr:hypothetical protein [Planctomycetaceae bacterium]
MNSNTLHNVFTTIIITQDFADVFQFVSFEDDFPKIEEEMKKLIKLDEAFERIELPHAEALELLAGMGQTLKAEHFNDGLAEEKTVSFYRQGEFLDLCRGPHIPSPRFIGAFKLTSAAWGIADCG